MKPYTLYTEVNKGDIVIFTDGSEKVIKKADDHIVIFEDGSKRDLWIIKDNIEGIIESKAEQPKPKAEPFVLQPVKQVQTKPLATTFSELKKAMYHGKDVVFYHYTEYHNVLSMIDIGNIYSRKLVKNIIKYDNAEKIDSTWIMTSTNQSIFLDKYARFYLNPKNEVTYAFHCSYKNNNTFGVIIELPFSALWKAKTNVILTPSNAHYLTDNYFDWKKLNIGFNERNLANYDSDKFNYSKTYFDYDPNVLNPNLTAETLFYEKVNVDLVEHFYFKTEYEKQLFLSKLDYNKRYLIQPKCVVNQELFW